MSEIRDTLDEILSDPIVQLVMERDRVRPQDVRILLERARSRGIRAGAVPPAHVIAESCRLKRMCL